ncbi:protein Bouncer-like [Labrus mixtus]|uniref:protein Bouncer-like n=1 Tax=Labrus mixtus TaxID=508554 RepID=UPI0029C0CEA5|nr:protein Bouncer-like [Labrus mixtus]
MTNFWKAVIVLCALVPAAQSLRCRQCPLGIFGSCLFGSDVTCNNATESCHRGEAQFNATGSLTLQIRGCLDSDLCGKTLTGSILGAGYTTSFQCCTTDLCNAAGSLQLPLTVALCAAILSSLWGTWDL